MSSAFLDVKSFETQEFESEAESPATFEAPGSHFLSVYGYEEGEPISDPVNEEYAEFLNELYDEEMNEAIAGLVAEAAGLTLPDGIRALLSRLDCQQGFGLARILKCSAPVKSER